MRFAGFLFTTLLLSATLGAEGKLDPLHVDGKHLVDSTGRVVILRGVVTIVQNNDGKPMVMTGEDYDRIKAWGYNVQQIRLGGCHMGLLPPCHADPDYFEKLDSWVDMGEQRGIYTIFKVTTYDVPGLDFATQFRKGAWDKLWDVSSGWQDQFIAGWSRLWEHFQGRSAVVGYDILNECFQGSNTKGFVHNYLFPFYRKAHAALERVDRQHLFIFQPPITSDDGLEPLGGENLLFAPHFYPHVTDPDALWRKILGEGETVKAAMLIGEYGLPNTPFSINGRLIAGASSPERDMADARLFDQSLMGTIKTWYTSVGNWSLLTPSHTEVPRFRYFSRPYPQRTAGQPKTFSFDFEKREWNFEWDPASTVNSPTLIFVAARRHYPDGFRVVTGDGVELVPDAKSTTGLRVAASHRRPEKGAFKYDAASEMLSVSGGTRSLRITPEN
jgi:hypothetical protein